MENHLSKILEDFNINFTEIDQNKEKYQIQKQWLDRFATDYKLKTGKYPPPNDLMWSAFAYFKGECIRGPWATEPYLSQPIEHFYIFNEGLKNCYICMADVYPDLSKYNRNIADYVQDIYIFPESMTWTMVFTHEDFGVQGTGPFFAKSPL